MNITEEQKDQVTEEVETPTTEQLKVVEEEQPVPTMTFSAIKKEGRFYTLSGAEITDTKYTKEVIDSGDLCKEEMDAVIKGFFYAQDQLNNVRINLSKLFENNG